MTKNTDKDKFESKSLFSRICLMLKGLRKPRATADYKLARVELQRLAAPIIAFLIPIIVLGVLCIVTMTVRSKFEFPIVEIPDVAAEEDIDLVEEPIPPDIEDIPDELPDIVEEDPRNIKTEQYIDTPPMPHQPVANPSIRPADADAVSMVNSPVVLPSMHGSRNPGQIGKLTSGSSTSYGHPTTEIAVMKVLWWLKATQNTDGSWGKDANSVANTALAVLTYLAHGEYPGSISPYAREFGPTVMRALEYLMSSIATDKDNVVHFNPSDSNEYSFLIGTYALCEAYGMTQNLNCKDAALQGLQRIIDCQSPTGGWDYKLNKNSTRDDLSYAGWAVQALKAGKIAGLHPSGIDDCIKKAIHCIKTRNFKNGGFNYTAGGNPTGLTATGCLAMQLLGYGSQPEVAQALDYMRDWQPTFDASKLTAAPKVPGGAPQYYCYYATQCKYQAGMKPGALKEDLDTWIKWNTAMKKIYPSSIIDLPDLVQDVDGKGHKQGYYVNKDAHSSRPYMDTCFVALQLMVYYRYLPTTQTIVEEKKTVQPSIGEIPVDVTF